MTDLTNDEIDLIASEGMRNAAEFARAVLAADRAKRAVPVAWQPIETRPTSEDHSFLVRRAPAGRNWSYTMQVSNFEGNMYPDHLDSNVDFDDRVLDATHWAPMLAAPGAVPPASATERAPLTPDEIDDIWAAASSDHDDTCNIHALVEAVEKHHGITTGDTHEQ